MPLHKLTLFVLAVLSLVVSDVRRRHLEAGAQMGRFEFRSIANDAVVAHRGRWRAGLASALVKLIPASCAISLLDGEADQICGAGRYERSADRADTRAVAL